MKNKRKGELEKIGAEVALKIGLPIGLGFSMVVLYLSLFPLVDLAIYFIGGKLFWHPIVWALIIPLVFYGLLWTGGKKLKAYIENDFPSLKSSFYFTLFVNLRLFSIIALVFVIGGFITSNQMNEDMNSLKIIGLGLSTTLFIFLLATIFITFTIGLTIVRLVEKKISVANNVYN